MNDRYDQMYDAAMRYFIRGETTESIARSMDVSRSTVSRLLAKAKENGIVRISIADHQGSRSLLAKRLSEAFNVRVHLVTVGDIVPPHVRLDHVAKVAGQLISSLVREDLKLGVAWGVTTATIAKHLIHHPVSGVSVIQMNGSTHATDVSAPHTGSLLHSYAESFSARVVYFPVPAFFDYAQTKQAMWQERSIQSVVAEIESLDLAVFGVGSTRGRVPSHVYALGYIDPHELADLEHDGVVADVCTVLLREDGSWADIAMNQRATGPTPAQLQQIERRICVVGDPHRAISALAALRAGVATDFVCDDATARAILKAHDRTDVHHS